MHSRNWNGEQFSVDMACGEVRDWRGSMEKVRQKHEGLVFHFKKFNFYFTDDRGPIKDFKKRCDTMRFEFYKHNSVSIFYKYNYGRAWAGGSLEKQKVHSTVRRLR